MARSKPSDKLSTYRQKRDFEVTPEPAPEVKAPERKPGERATFMVHKHDATRLHYDLRLEMEGALASWAVPKGPSYDPDDKRLAVQTEDHPLAYGGFEGRIPDGEYGAGDSLIWDRGVWDTVPPGQASAQRKKGHLHIALDGEKLKGEWHLVRTRPVGGKAQWILFKAKDGTEKKGYDVVAERPESVKSGRRITRGPERAKTLRAVHPPPLTLLARIWPPEKATLSSLDDVREGSYALEVKYDGFRALAALSNGKVALQSRNALDLSARFPAIAKALSKVVVGEAVIDGEIVALDKKGRPSFQLLQTPGADERFFAFDLLWLNGEDLRKRPLEERRELLESLLGNAEAPLGVARRIELPPAEALELARGAGLEGIIAKKKGSPYVGVRSKDWLKVKVTNSQEFAILGYEPISTGGKEVGSLILGVHDDDGFHYAGGVGTGFTAAVRRELYKRLEQDRTERSPAVDAPRIRDARWVTPKLVAQVAFTEWTRDGKLRHPSFQGLRSDKRPEECVREVPQKVKAAAQVKAIGSKATGTRRAPQRLAAKTSRASRVKKPSKK